jgi:RNA polymerase sigma-70 factor (ECF subfamily)
MVFRLRNGDEAAFTLLYRQYANALLGIICKVLDGDIELSKEVLQEGMLKVWKNINSYDSTKGTLFTWMLNICRNMAIDKTRSRSFKNQQKNESMDAKAWLENKFQYQPQPETIGVVKMLDILQPSQREVVDTIYMLGYSHSEAAERLQIPVGTVKTRLRSAILELRKHFNE